MEKCGEKWMKSPSEKWDVSMKFTQNLENSQVFSEFSVAHCGRDLKLMSPTSTSNKKLVSGLPQSGDAQRWSVGSHRGATSEAAQPQEKGHKASMNFIPCFPIS